MRKIKSAAQPWHIRYAYFYFNLLFYQFVEQDLLVLCKLSLDFLVEISCYSIVFELKALELDSSIFELFTKN